MSKRKFSYVSSRDFSAPSKITPRKFAKYKAQQMQIVPRSVAYARKAERKYFDSFLSATQVVTAATWAGSELDPATLLTLFLPREGSDIDNRIGRKVSVVKMQIRGVLKLYSVDGTGAFPNSPQVRLIVYVDHQTNGAQCQGETVMQDPGAVDTELTALTFQNTANFGRFQVLSDKTVAMNRRSAVGTAVANDIEGLTLPFKITKKFSTPIVTQFTSANGGTIADIVSNSFHMIGMYEGGSQPYVIYQARFTYYDV